MIDNFAERVNGPPKKVPKDFFELDLEFLQMLENMDYQSVANAFLLVSKANCVFVNLLDVSGEKFVIKVACGPNFNISEARSLSEYCTLFCRRLTDYTKCKSEQISDDIIIFSSLDELLGEEFIQSEISKMMNGLDIGQIAVANITKDGILLGNVIFLMPKGKNFSKHNRIRFYLKHLGLSIIRKKAEQLARQNIELSESLIKILQQDFNSIEELIYFTLNEALKITESKLAYAFIYNEDSNEIELACISDNILNECKLEKNNIKVDFEKAGFWANVIKEKQSIVINCFDNLDFQNNYVNLSRCLSVPIFDKGKIVMVAAVANKDSDYTKYDESSLTILFSNAWIRIIRKRNEEMLINEKELLEATLKSIEYLSYHDQLTGLYNRRFFEEELRRLDTDRNLPIAVIMADINGLKLANDAFGHEFGDEILKKAADALRLSCRRDDIIARIGGDEFAVLLPKTSEEGVKQVIDRIVIAAANTKVGSINLSISCGWEVKKSAEEDINEIIKRAENLMYKNKLFESSSMRNMTISTIVKTLYEAHPLEEKHSKRVSDLCVAIGKEILLSSRELSELKTIGLLHDIGKVAIDKSIINKTGPLTEEEIAEMRRHPEIGYRILSCVGDFSEIAQYVLAHHENWDGSGYPKGLKGEEIPLKARIAAIADAYDFMTNYKPYPRTLSQNEAVEELKKGAGKEYDPDLVAVFIEKVLIKYHF